MSETDPKSVQNLTAVVQTLLQQMQDKFQTMSDQIIGRNILSLESSHYNRGYTRWFQTPSTPFIAIKWLLMKHVHSYTFR
ncbi:hypothetical protein ANANG_G00099540 [Anguilla anguilla]|uniref:Heat shock factor-binding protein 1 n=1 Tax=Anguilla anguilla TaxID=7936 RepID=A0A9D3MGL9_ANGAN|nr:hypothetical protein ANANG_G00099540 [Anguilla anguilla]